MNLARTQEPRPAGATERDGVGVGGGCAVTVALETRDGSVKSAELVERPWASAAAAGAPTTAGTSTGTTGTRRPGEKHGDEGEAARRGILRSQIRAIVGHITETALGETVVSGIRSQISFSEGDTHQEGLLISGVNHKNDGVSNPTVRKKDLKGNPRLGIFFFF